MDCGIRLCDNLGYKEACEKSETLGVSFVTPNIVGKEKCCALRPLVAGGTYGHKTNTYVATSN